MHIHSSVYATVRGILHDPEVYPDPDTFNPDRFMMPDGSLNPDVPKPDIAFGFGRRICPVSSDMTIICSKLANHHDCFISGSFHGNRFYVYNRGLSPRDIHLP